MHDPHFSGTRKPHMSNPVIYWYRQDLRVQDLPGLHAALSTGRPVIPCFVLDDAAPGKWKDGAASRWWLHHSLQSLSQELSDLGSRLVLLQGDTFSRLLDLANETGADTIYCSRRYEPWATEQEQNLHRKFADRAIALKRYRGALLYEPGDILNGSGQAFKVFTPFWRACLAGGEPRPAGGAEGKTGHWFKGQLGSDALEQWYLRPSAPDWAADWPSYWTPGSGAAQDKLRAFLAGPITDYDEGRNHPARQATTRLSPHLHFGELSPRQVWHAARQLQVSDPASTAQVDKFLSELGWREFSHHLLYHFPNITDEPFKPRFRQFPWVGSAAHLRAWQQGQTGYPLVDAGMRELWYTGFMHNRVRMVVASFLTKHLLLPWQEGARWFWDTLVDADLANNSCGWQWVAGSGADAAPYFRIFNPETQGKKFDGEGRYIRHWVPEIAGLPDKYLNCPWDAPAQLLQEAGLASASNYPSPIVDHREARAAALAAYDSIRQADIPLET